MEGRVDLAGFGYHEVTDDPTAAGFQRPSARPYKLTRAAFARHLDAIGSGPCVPTLAGDVDPAREGRCLLLSFDDGGKSALYAGDELCRRGWRGHFFIVTDFIGRPHFLDAGEIRYLRSCGHVIGSHSHTHPDIVRDLPPARMLDEWWVSNAVLAGLLGEPCLMASIPGGDISRQALATAAAAGFRYVFTSEPWLRPRRVNEAWILGRFLPNVGTDPVKVSRMANFEGWTRALMVRRLKVLARRAAPVLYREYVRRTMRESASAAT
jgi:peptidoglycan/xylan/chitin deacetylase (PgdA/CDA1 family)